ncbi:MAG TPA: DUF2933 domain-containing protein [Thermoleophilia bacterium]|nr:DUF2933 domain-containing protein [Thermoleophilia bacterium]
MALLPLLLLVVVCPLVMFLMMRGMHGHGSKNAAADPRTADGSLNVVQLRELRDDLEARIDDLDDRINDLETTKSTTRPTSALND